MSAHLEEWHFREFCSAVGLVSASWRDLRDHFDEVDRMGPAQRSTWIAQQELKLECEAYDERTRRKILRAMQRGGATELGKLLNEGHDFRQSAALAFWLSSAVLSAE